MKTTITLENHLEELVNKTKTSRDTLLNQCTYIDEQLVSIAYMFVDKISVYVKECCEWRQENSVDKTWKLFKTHFTRKFKYLHESNHTAVTSVYT